MTGLTTPSTPPAPSMVRGALRWTLRLPTAPGAVMTALEALASSDVRVLSREPSRLVLAYRHEDLALRVAVELRAHGDGAELVAIEEGRSVSEDNVKAALLTAFVLFMGLGMPDYLPLRYLMFAASVPSLMVLIATWIDARQRRRADFTRILQAVDRAVSPLKTRDPRPYRGSDPIRSN